MIRNINLTCSCIMEVALALMVEYTLARRNQNLLNTFCIDAFPSEKKRIHKGEPTAKSDFEILPT